MRRGGPIKRRAPIARGAPPKRSGPIKAKPRPASETRRIYGPKARIKLVSRLPCAACGDTDPSIPRENAHGESGGTGRKADYTTILPLCHRCHHKQHQSGWLAIGMSAEGRSRAAANTEAEWQSYLSRGTDDE